jgi:hypothetical protein
MIYFLHTDAEKAASAVCDQDVRAFLEIAVRELQHVHKPIKEESLIQQWLLEDGMNYHWLGYFAQHLQVRDGVEFYSEVLSLRRCPPCWLICAEQTEFPWLLWNTQKAPPSLLLDYRVAYVRTRHKYATWDEFGCPAWILKVANIILAPKDRKAFLTRVQPREAYE